jgi:hypothetical protein
MQQQQQQPWLFTARQHAFVIPFRVFTEADVCVVVQKVRHVDIATMPNSSGCSLL